MFLLKKNGRNGKKFVINGMIFGIVTTSGSGYMDFMTDSFKAFA